MGRRHHSLAQEIRWLKQEKGSATKKDLERLENGEPVDYVIGFAEFLGCKIDLSKRPFIPRPETEFWVGEIVNGFRNGILHNRISSAQRQTDSARLTVCPARRRGPCQTASASLCKIPFPHISVYPLDSPHLLLKSLRCLDIFAGSGCIGIAILKHVPFARVDFAEKEKKFCEQIKINAKLNGINPKRYRVIQSDVFSNVKGGYDYIFANPPYIAESRKNKVQPSVLNYESKEALFAGRDGLFAIRKFLQGVKDHLNPGGKIYMEFDSFQKPLIAKILRSEDFRAFKFFRDQYKKWRYVVIE